MFLYRLICLVLFVVVMSTLAHVISDNGAWGHGFAWGTAIGGVVGAFAGTAERRQKRQGTML